MKVAFIVHIVESQWNYIPYLKIVFSHFPSRQSLHAKYATPFSFLVHKFPITALCYGDDCLSF